MRNNFASDQSDDDDDEQDFENWLNSSGSSGSDAEMQGLVFGIESSSNDENSDNESVNEPDENADLDDSAQWTTDDDDDNANE